VHHSFCGIISRRQAIVCSRFVHFLFFFSSRRRHTSWSFTFCFVVWSWTVCPHSPSWAYYNHVDHGTNKPNEFPCAHVTQREILWDNSLCLKQSLHQVSDLDG